MQNEKKWKFYKAKKTAEICWRNNFVGNIFAKEWKNNNIFKLYLDNGPMGPESKKMKNIFRKFRKIFLLGMTSFDLEMWEEGNIAIVFLMGRVRERVKKSQKNEMKCFGGFSPLFPLFPQTQLPTIYNKIT